MRRLLVSLVLLPLLFVAGCGGDDRPTASQAWIGSYTLLSVDGDPVPSTILQAPSYLLEITNGSGSVNGDVTYSLLLTFWEDDDGIVSILSLTSVGTYTRLANTFMFTDAQDGSRATRVFAINRMTLTDDEGFVYFFQK